MKSRSLLKILLIALIIFFQVRLLSHIFLKCAEIQDDQQKQKFIKVSHLFFPLDYFTSYKYAFHLLDKGVFYKNNPLILKSINWFKKTIRQNPFYHLSHHNLGKAYLSYNYPQREFFDQGIQELKKAVQIDKNNKIMVKDTSEILLSMWPLLSDIDKKLCKNLLMGLMPKFSREEFKTLVELWWLYSKDIPVLKQLVQKKPSFLNNLALLIVELKGPLKLRWEFIADYETFVLKQVITQYRNRYSSSQSQLNFELSLLDRLRDNRAYYKLANKNFDYQKYIKYKNILLYNRIKLLLSKNKKRTNTRLNEEINHLVLEFVNGKPDVKDLVDLENLLESRGFFKENDFKSLHLKYWLKFNQGNMNDIIDEIEKIKQSITFVKSEALLSYERILLLLSNAYESSKLLTIANKTLREILNYSSEDPEVWLQLFLIQKTLGPDIEIHAQIKERVENIKKSRFINVDSLEYKQTVYFVDDKQIKISLDQTLEKELNKKKIIQIFINNKIVYEEYLSKLPGIISIDVEKGNEIKKVEVEVMFL